MALTVHVENVFLKDGMKLIGKEMTEKVNRSYKRNQVPKSERNQAIMQARLAGKSFRQIGAEAGVSAVRVRQIFVRESIRANHMGN